MTSRVANENSKREERSKEPGWGSSHNVEKQVADYLGMNESDFATRETRNPQSSSGSGCCRLADRN